MHRYERDEYEDLDEYEDDVEEHEEDEEEDGDEPEETYEPSQEELEYLELRQRLKESIRKQLKKELGTASAGSRDKTKTYHKDNYGSFFGPSQPVIAQRVIQESKSLLENPNLAARITKPNYANNKNSSSATIKSKPQTSIQSKVTTTSGLKKKVEILKNTRDYSFLLSEDAEVPSSMKSPPPRNLPVPKSDARPVEILSKSKKVVNDSGRGSLYGREERKKVLAGSQSRIRQETIGHASMSSMGNRKQLGSNNGSGPGRPLGPKVEHSKSPVTSVGKKVPPVSKNSMAGLDKPTPSPSLQSAVRRPTTTNLQSGVRKPTSSSLQPSIKNHPVQRREYQESSKQKVQPKQALPSSRTQIKQQPSKIPAHSKLPDGRPKAKSGRRPFDENSDDEAINMIRGMFRYDPSKYKDADDDSDMEANFDDILREEKHSAKIARKEDEEELRLLEEEKRKQMRMAKKRKLSQQ